jgi:tetratricopeptide (TPR) repeat protein
MSTPRRGTFGITAVIAIALLAGAAAYFYLHRKPSAPATGSDAYEQATRHFYRGLAHLQVGLIDTALQEFTAANTTAPNEPAIWANLGLAHLRLGAFDAAAPAIERASKLAPKNSDVAFLSGRLEIARGHRDAGLAEFRRAIVLDGRNLPARTALIQELENGATPGEASEAQRLVDQLVALVPENLAVLVERARLAAKRGDAGTLKDSVARLARSAKSWPPDVAEQFRTLQQDAGRSSFADASRDVAFLRNLLVQVPAYLEARRAVTPPAELIAEPFAMYLSLPQPASTPAAADEALSFGAEPLGQTGPARTSVLAMSLDGDQPPVVLASNGSTVQRVDAAGPSLALPASPNTGAPTTILAADWNSDFRTDLVTAGPGGVRLFLQSADGSFTDATSRAWGDAKPPAFDATGVWAADLDMDGDLDLIVGVRGGASLVLRNNGDGSWRQAAPFAQLTGVRGFAWGDLDGDGDPDAAVVDDTGILHVFMNQQAGQFAALPGPPASKNISAVAIGDVNGDGVLDVVTLDTSGAFFRSSISDGRWTSQPLASWRAATRQGAKRAFLADLDNNGALDLIASDATGAAAFLADADHSFKPMASAINAAIWSVADLNGDGQLDLVGLANGRPVRLLGHGTRGYHYQVVRPRAQRAAGDQRVNTFGIGSELEVRAGLLVQKRVVTDPAMHVGLGTKTAIDVTRIMWTNGVPQVEFDPPVDQPLVAEQRLKGSCPWVFADNGRGMQFVTDFLWRSPLGLRINAQDTAAITQTEDWVRIRGDQLVAKNGVYDVRITAELWETHFIDHAALVAVDHPADSSVFVDERFSREAPKLAVQAMKTPRPIARAVDQAGADVTDVVQHLDGRALDTFQRGKYQGVAAEHFLDIDLGVEIPADVPMWLVAQGWIYPTDSSINVAIGQGGHDQPRGLSLEAEDATGRWVMVAPDLGFPAGKNKSILIDLSMVARAGVAHVRRLRLKTNLEIYWDALSVAEALPAETIRTTRIEPAAADLRFRGFSVTERARRDQPEVPIYGRLANTAPRWRDLVGFYTRFGDVRELLTRVDDRYVIMNAGDELRLSFAAPAAAPPAGWVRDFVLVGDGWEKDGDYNTSYSKTVLPLPQHGRPEYVSISPSIAADPVYRQHRSDWVNFHTRFVSPDLFLDGLSRVPRPDQR